MPRYWFIPKVLNYQLQILLKYKPKIISFNLGLNFYNYFKYYKRYIIAFSGAIGLLNLVPCWALDGQYILQATLAIYKSGYGSSHNLFDDNNKKPLVYILMMLLGTGLLLLNLILALFSLLYSKISFNL